MGAVFPVALIVISLLLGAIKKVDVFDTFKLGAKDGLTTVYNIFPNMLGLILAVTMLKESGFFDLFCKAIQPFCDFIGIPSEVIPLGMLRPFSGSGATALFNNILNTYPATSKIPIISGVMMGSSETTFYVIAVYLSSFNIKADYKVVVAALLADLFVIIGSVLFVNMLM